jgi:hypothetical protein
VARRSTAISWNTFAWRTALEKAGVAAGREAGLTLRVYSPMMLAAPDKLRQAIDATYRSDGTATAQKAGSS